MPDDKDRVDIIPEYLSEFYDDVPEEIEGDEADLQAFANIPIETQLDLPKDHSAQDGLYMTHTPERLYGTANTIKIIRKVGHQWMAMHPGSAIGIGDISKRGGGQISGHASHRKGIDFDVRPMRNDGRKEPVTIRQSAYSRELTQQLISLFINNGILRCTHVFFNDPALRTPPIQPWPHHENHFHVRFVVG